MRARVLVVAACASFACTHATTAYAVHGLREPSFELECHDFVDCEAKVQEVCPRGHDLVGTTDGASAFELYDRDVQDAPRTHEPVGSPEGSVSGKVVVSCS